MGGQSLGGIVNYGSGMGTGVDKSQGSFFTPTRIYWRSPMEILYIQSWAARKFCDIPVDDMFLRWRTWSDGEDMEGSADAMRDAEREYKVAMKLNAAMWAARLHGGALAVMMLKDGPMTSELVPDRIREGDFMGFRVFDRFDVQVIERETDPMNPEADGPLIYQITPSRVVVRRFLSTLAGCYASMGSSVATRGASKPTTTTTGGSASSSPRS